MRFHKAMCIALLAGGLVFAGQGTTPKPDRIEERAANVDGVYGTIKKVTLGKEIVIAVDNAPDKTYNLADPKQAVSVAEGLAIGDKVKVVESRKKDGKTIQIVRDVRDRQQK